MFDLPAGFWDEPAPEPPGEPARPANRAAAQVTQVPAPGPVTPAAPAAEEADSPLALVQLLFPGRIVSIERPEAAESEPLAADEPAFADDDELPPED
jgi:hypothetical protein